MMKTTQPRKQRYARYNAPLHTRRHLLSVHLSPELRAKYGIRALPVRKGDAVKVMVGDQRGKEGKVASVEKQRVNIDGITRAKTDGTKVFAPVHASSLLLIDLDLSDERRKKILERKGKKTAPKTTEGK